MMKHSSRLLGMCAVLCALALGTVISGCKDTAPDPTYVDFGAIRVMQFAQCTSVPSIRFLAYPTNNISDTVLRTPTAVTYGVSTPYVNNLPTGRGAGQTYHLVALSAGTNAILHQTDVTLMPGDKYTWALFEPDANNNFSPLLVKDVPVANSSNSMAYFRLMNVSSGTSGEHLMVGDPVNGFDLTPSGVNFSQVSAYNGIPTAFDTTVTLYVTDANHQILGRLAGVSLGGGSYHTIAWGGQLNDNCRAIDFSGNHIPDDSIRVHVFDDNTAGNDALPVPVTLRYNIINALIPPNSGGHAAGFPNYTDSGLAVVINNNTVYDYNHVQPFTPLPFWKMAPDGVAYYSIPDAIPYTGLAYIRFVKPVGPTPTFGDSILFRFYGSTQRIVSDQLVSFIVFDTVQSTVSENKAAIPYDSAGRVYTMQIPDQSDPNTATIVFANTICATKSSAPQVKGDFIIAGKTISNMQPKPTSPALITGIAPGTVNLHGTLNGGADAINDVNFTAERGAIYEVLLVGQRARPDNDPRYLPKFMVIRTNPIRN